MVHAFWKDSLKIMTPCEVFHSTRRVAVAVLAGVAFAVTALPAFAASAFKSGEVIRYTVKQAGVKAGEATITFTGETERDGKKYTLIVFSARGFNFFDEERIFVDNKTFLPQVVVRDINIFGNKEKITEVYDQAAGSITVTKVAGERTTVQVLDKKGAVDNIYGFIYRYRRDTAVNSPQTFDVHLPTLDVTIAPAHDLSFNAAGKTYKATLLRSVPSKYSIWMDKSAKRLPLRIAGAIGIANTVMTLIDYKE